MNSVKTSTRATKVEERSGAAAASSARVQTVRTLVAVTPALVQTARLSGSGEIERKLRSLIMPEIKFRSASLAEVVAFFQVQSQRLDAGSPEGSRGINFMFSARPEVAAKAAVTMQASNLPMGEALRMMEAAGLRYRVSDDGVEITADVPNALSPQPASSPIVVEADQTSFDRATSKVSAKGEVRIETAAAVIQAPEAEITVKGSAGSSATPVHGGGIVLPKLEIQDAALEQALGTIRQEAERLDPAGKGVAVVVEGRWRSNGPASLTLNMKNVSVHDALRFCAELAGGKLSSREGVYVIAPAQK